MKNILILTLIISFISIDVYSSGYIYESKFYNVNISNEAISDAKLREIEKIKVFSLFDILDRILTKENLKILKNSLDINNEINYLIKNIIIEDEFISTNKYSANIKINFDSFEIIRLLRNYKINYTDLESSNMLLVSSKKNELLEEGLSLNNSLYKELKFNKNGLLKISYPNLSANDRYILPYKKILSKDKKSLLSIANKYSAEFVVIINLQQINYFNNFEIYIFSTRDNNLLKINSFTIESASSYKDQIFFIIENWWKQFNLINNSKLNMINCVIKNSNIHELNFINKKIKSMSQIKSLSLKRINLGENDYEIIFYGKLKNLSSKLLKYKINILINDKNECIISTFN